MKMNNAEIIDRWSIAKLKFERIPGEDKCRSEYYELCIEINKLIDRYGVIINDYCNILLSINDYIWQIEAGLKSKKESIPNKNYLFDKDNKDILYKFGIQVIIIRNYNDMRISVKNLINKLTGDKHIDHRKDHLSSSSKSILRSRKEI